MGYAFINSGKNDMFSSLKGLDLQDLLVETENQPLTFRESLELPSDVTFGTEIEYEDVSIEKVTRFVDDNLPNWDSTTDGSLNSGGEINSPVMSDDKKYWKELKTICEYLTQAKARTSGNAGGHIHVGAHVLGEDIEAWRGFLKLYTAYESVLFRFAYGDKLSARRRLHDFAPPVAQRIHSNLRDINSATDIYDIKWAIPSHEKYQALNFNHVEFDSLGSRSFKNTLELRCPNATTNAVVWQNNINAFAKMLVSAHNKAMNEDFLDFKLKHEFVSYYDGGEYLYSEINLKNVLEFVDLAFDNNLDKIYFLRQYLKGFQDSYGTKSAQPAASFTR